MLKCELEFWRRNNAIVYRENFYALTKFELITCSRRANENAGNLISVVQFLIKPYIRDHHEIMFIFTQYFRSDCDTNLKGRRQVHCTTRVDN